MSTKQRKFQLGDKVTAVAHSFGEVGGQGTVVDARKNRGGYIVVRFQNGLEYPVQPSRLTLGHAEVKPVPGH